MLRYGLVIFHQKWWSSPLNGEQCNYWRSSFGVEDAHRMYFLGVSCCPRASARNIHGEPYFHVNAGDHLRNATGVSKATFHIMEALQRALTRNRGSYKTSDVSATSHSAHNRDQQHSHKPALSPVSRYQRETASRWVSHLRATRRNDRH